MSAVKVYIPREATVKVHQTRVKPCPDGLLAGYYWYGNKKKGPGCPRKRSKKVLSDENKEESEQHPESKNSAGDIDKAGPAVGSAEPERELPGSKSVTKDRRSERYSLRRATKS